VPRDVPDRFLRRPGDRAGVAALCVAIAVVAGIAGCDGDDSNGSGSNTGTETSAQSSTSTGTSTTSGNGGTFRIERVGPERQVRHAVVAVLTSGDPADACGKYVTEHYLKVAYGGRQGCVLAQSPGSAARSLHSYRAQFGEVAGTATAVAIPLGGPYDGARVRVSLIQGGQGYQVDSLRSKVPVGP
jgi:hypothetical protein